MIPADYDNPGGHPAWDIADRWAWQRFVPDRIREIWDTFSTEQKQAIAEWADNLSDQALDYLASHERD